MSFSLFNLYDYIFFAFILFFGCVGLIRGFWIQLFSLIVWLLGIIFYYYSAPKIEQVHLSKYLSIPVAHWFVLATILVGCFFINFLIRFLLSSLFKLNAFTFFNKIGGLLLGILSSALIILLLIYSINSSDISNEISEWKKSYVILTLTPFLEKLNERNNQNISLLSSNVNMALISHTNDAQEVPQ